MADFGFTAAGTQFGFSTDPLAGPSPITRGIRSCTHLISRSTATGRRAPPPVTVGGGGYVSWGPTRRYVRAPRPRGGFVMGGEALPVVWNEFEVEDEEIVVEDKVVACPVGDARA